MRLVLLGVPGSGKGTQGEVLAAHYGIRHVSSGDLLRHEVAAHTPLGEEVKSFIDDGELVPDELVFSVVAGALDDAARAQGYILDGFPRTLAQAQRARASAPPAGIAVDAVVYLDLSDKVARSRLSGRAAEGRVDDGDSVIERRLAVYHHATQPLLGFYRALRLLRAIDANAPIPQVTATIIAAIDASAA